jgi:hypothetical protein
MAARGTVWSHNEVLTLIDIWKAEDIEAQLENVHRNLPNFNRVAELMNLRGYERTGAQCRSKMKALKSEYNKHINIIRIIRFFHRSCQYSMISCKVISSTKE